MSFSAVTMNGCCVEDYVCLCSVCVRAKHMCIMYICLRESICVRICISMCFVCFFCVHVLTTVCMCILYMDIHSNWHTYFSKTRGFTFLLNTALLYSFFSMFNHPNVIQYLGHGLDDLSRPFILMEVINVFFDHTFSFCICKFFKHMRKKYNFSSRYEFLSLMLLCIKHVREMTPIRFSPP